MYLDYLPSVLTTCLLYEVGDASDLEGRCGLRVLQFEMHGAAGQLRQRETLYERCSDVQLPRLMRLKRVSRGCSVLAAHGAWVPRYAL